MSILSSSSSSSSSTSTSLSLSCQLSIDPERTRGAVLGWQRPPPRRSNLHDLVHRHSPAPPTRYTPYSIRPAVKSHLVPSYHQTLPFVRGPSSPFHTPLFAASYTSESTRRPASSSSSTSTSPTRPLFAHGPLCTSPGDRQRTRLQPIEAAAPPLIPLTSYEGFMLPPISHSHGQIPLPQPQSQSHTREQTRKQARHLKATTSTSTITSPNKSRGPDRQQRQLPARARPQNETQDEGHINVNVNNVNVNVNNVTVVKPGKGSFVCVFQYEEKRIYAIGAEELETTLHNLRLIFSELQGIAEAEVQLYGLIPRASSDTPGSDDSGDPDRVGSRAGAGAGAGGLFLPSSSSGSVKPTSQLPQQEPPNKSSSNSAGDAAPPAPPRNGGTRTKAFRMTPSLYAEVRRAHLDYHSPSPSPAPAPAPHSRQSEIKEEDRKTKGRKVKIPHFMVLTAPQLGRLVVPRPDMESAAKPDGDQTGMNPKLMMGSQRGSETAKQSARPVQSPQKDRVRLSSAQRQKSEETRPSAPILTGSTKLPVAIHPRLPAEDETMEVEPIQIQPVTKTPAPEATTPNRFTTREQAISALIELSSKFSSTRTTVDVGISYDKRSDTAPHASMEVDSTKELDVDTVVAKKEEVEKMLSPEVALHKSDRSDQPIGAEESIRSTEALVDKVVVETKPLVFVKTEPVEELMEVERPTVKSPPATPMKSLVADQITPPHPLAEKTADVSDDIVDPFSNLRALTRPPVTFNVGQVNKRSYKKNRNGPSSCRQSIG